MTDPWETWEDYAAGFYKSSIPIAMHVADSLELLTDPERFLDTAKEMMDHWTNSVVHNLVYMCSGQNAWIGQASCLYAHGAPPSATRKAWGKMTGTQQETANAVAAKARQEWEGVRCGCETLFEI